MHSALWSGQSQEFQACSQRGTIKPQRTGQETWVRKRLRRQTTSSHDMPSVVEVSNIRPDSADLFLKVFYASKYQYDLITQLVAAQIRPVNAALSPFYHQQYDNFPIFWIHEEAYRLEHQKVSFPKQKSFTGNTGIFHPFARTQLTGNFVSFLFFLIVSQPRRA